VEHAESLAGFFVALDLHPRKQQANGKQVLVLYQSHVRRELFDALKRNEGFNIEIIQDTLLRSFVEEISNKILDKKIEQVGPSVTTHLIPRSPGLSFSSPSVLLPGTKLSLAVRHSLPQYTNLLLSSLAILSLAFAACHLLLLLAAHRPVPALHWLPLTLPCPLPAIARPQLAPVLRLHDQSHHHSHHTTHSGHTVHQRAGNCHPSDQQGCKRHPGSLNPFQTSLRVRP
jgi:hypothetical protein